MFSKKSTKIWQYLPVLLWHSSKSSQIIASWMLPGCFLGVSWGFPEGFLGVCWRLPRGLPGSFLVASWRHPGGFQGSSLYKSLSVLTVFVLFSVTTSYDSIFFECQGCSKSKICRIIAWRVYKLLDGWSTNVRRIEFDRKSLYKPETLVKTKFRIDSNGCNAPQVKISSKCNVEKMN